MITFELNNNRFYFIFDRPKTPNNMQRLKILSQSIVFFIILCLSSCAFHSGLMTGNATLSGSNFELIDIVTGEASTVRVLGIGGTSTKALVLEAKKDLYSSNRLKKGQAFANVSVDFHNAFYLLVNVTTVTVSADIVQFGDMTESTQAVFRSLGRTQAENEKNKIRQKTPAIPKKVESIATISLGDSVLFIDDKKISSGELVEIKLPDWCYITLAGDLSEPTKAVSINNVFSSKLDSMNFKGRVYYREQEVYTGGMNSDVATIKAFGRKNLLLEKEINGETLAISRWYHQIKPRKP